MGGFAEAAIKRSIQAVIERDRTLAEQVITGDVQLNDTHRDLREEIFMVIATQQPVARDLRMVMGIQYIAAELERIGDYAVRIAKRVLQMTELPQDEPMVDLSRLAELVEAQVHDILDALVQLDATLATSIAERDRQIDRLYQHVFGEQISQMAERPEMAMQAQLVINVAHTLERIGDRVINIAEDIVFLDSGKVMELNEPA
jgi:phosphate transport system protein